MKERLAADATLSFAEARQREAEARFGEAAAVLSQPNNILAVEYCKALYGLRLEMQPFAVLRQGNDLVTIRTVERRLKEREVALYKRDSGQLVLHRVIEVYEDSYGIRGDNTFGIEKVRDDQILGVLTEVIRDGKTISVTDPEYLKYVERNLKSYPVRLAKRKCRNALSKAKRRLLG